MVPLRREINVTFDIIPCYEIVYYYRIIDLFLQISNCSVPGYLFIMCPALDIKGIDTFRAPIWGSSPGSSWEPNRTDRQRGAFLKPTIMVTEMLCDRQRFVLAAIYASLYCTLNCTMLKHTILSHTLHTTLKNTIQCDKIKKIIPYRN